MAKDEVVLLSVMAAVLLVICCLLSYICFCKDQFRVQRRRRWSNKAAFRTAGAQAGHMRLPAEVVVPHELNGHSDGSEASHSNLEELDDGKGVGDRRMVPYAEESSDGRIVLHQPSTNGRGTASESELDAACAVPHKEDDEPQAAQGGQGEHPDYNRHTGCYHL